MKWILALVLMLSMTIPVYSQGPCTPFAPYYHSTTNSLGSLMGDVFFFAMSTPIAVATVGGRRRNVVSPHGEQYRVPTAVCMPIATAHHFITNRPAHVEHWRIE